MLYAHNYQGRLSVFKQCVDVAIDLTIEVSKVIIRVIAVMHRFGANLCLRRAGNEVRSIRARRLWESCRLIRLIRTLQDPGVIEFQGQNVEFDLLTGECQERANVEGLADCSSGLPNEISGVKGLEKVG